VIPYGTLVPVAVRLFANCYTSYLYLFLPLSHGMDNSDELYIGSRGVLRRVKSEK